MQANILAEEGYKKLFGVSGKGVEDRSEPDSSEDMRRIRAAILAGDYFPDCPDSGLAYQQILTVFGEAPGAFKLATDRMAERHHDSWTEKLYGKSIQLDPKNARSWNNLGKLLCNMNRSEEAEDAYRNVIALDPKNAWSWNSLGILLNVHLHRLKEAESAFRKSIELDPKYAPSWNNLGNLLCDMNRSEEAEKAYRNAIRLDPKGAWS